MDRSPPNKGHVEFPSVLHLRCTDAMREEVRARGGCRWLRSLIAANTRPPAAVDPPWLQATGDPVGDTIGRETTDHGKPRRRVSRRSPKPGKRVSLDKGKQKRVKSRVSRRA